MFPFVISSFLRVLSLKRICPVCKKGQTVPSGAREKRDKARKQISNNIDPLQVRKVTKAMVAGNAENTFEAISREWHQLQSTKWADRYAKKIIRRFELYIFHI